MWPEPCRFIYLSGSKIQGILKLNIEDFADYFPPSKNGMTGPGVNHLSKKLVFFIKSPGY